MEITTDVLLRGEYWAKAIDSLSPLFKAKSRPNYSIFLLCIAIGIMYDKKIERFDDVEGEEPRNVPRNVMQNQNSENGCLDFMFQAAILSTRTENYTEEERLEHAFGEKSSMNKIAFLTQFANYGVTELVQRIGETTIETMENLKQFLSSTVEGNNFDIDAVPDDIWLEDM